MSTVSLRERKKVETRRAIARAALDLAVAQGPDAVTVDDIAAQADVSPRTVFNHFGTKDEAILGIDPDRRAATALAVLERPAEETPLEAIAAVLIGLMTRDDSVGPQWLTRSRLVRAHPQLRAAYVASHAALEQAITRSVAERLGTDPERDPYPRYVAHAALGAFWIACERGASGGRVALGRELRSAFRVLASGFEPPRRPVR
ncbi:MAG: TetR/AcrR family transcriptional regulator [Acidimicrobiia bacterium]